MNKQLKEYMKRNGKKGGETTLAKHGKEHFSQNGKKGSLARTGKKRGKYKKRKEVTAQ